MVTIPLSPWYGFESVGAERNNYVGASGNCHQLHSIPYGVIDNTSDFGSEAASISPDGADSLISV